MRKFLLILLNVLCLANSWSQNYIVSKKTYSRNSVTDTFILKYNLIQNYNKKNCVDTFRQEFAENNAASSRTFLSNKSKYDAKKSLTEREYHRIDWSKNSSAEFKEINNSRTREKYGYSLPSIKHDTVFTELYDTITKVWKPYLTSLKVKPNFGIDTIWEGSAMIVKNNNAREIVRATMLLNKRAYDSTVNFYDNNDRLIGRELYSSNIIKFRLYYKDFRVFNGEKLTEFHIYSINSVNDTTRTKTIYNYNVKGLLESEVSTAETAFANNTKPKAITTSRIVYTDYNAKNKNTVKKAEMWVDATQSWDITTATKTYYLSDTLIFRDTTLGYSKGQITGKDVINIYEYEACESVVSSSQDVISQGLDFTLAPNPTSGSFNLSLSEEALQSGVSISVYNIQGGEVFRTKLTSESTAIDLSNLSKGLYLVKVADKTHFTVKKLVLN
jgi:Secretion system C-terminal sorting domain